MLKENSSLGPYTIVKPIVSGAWVRCTRRATRDSDAGWLAKPCPASSATASSARPALPPPSITLTFCTLYDVGPDYVVMEYVEGILYADL